MIEDLEKHVLPNGEEVLFVPSTHTYSVKGEEVPSITTLLKMEYGDTYSAVNPGLLKRSSEYGTSVHNEIQSLIGMREIGVEIDRALLESSHQETRNYFEFIEPVYHVDPLETEKVVVLYDMGGNPIAAGRFDLLCNVNGEKTLADFKTTSTIHRQLVTGQLNLYLKAARQSGYLGEDEPCKLAAIHLSGSKSKLLPIATLADSFVQRFMTLDLTKDTAK